ncbi:MAG: ribonuclease H-like YkuK family protein [Thermaerobacter sp.]|nr:ribonuclease H-like YkuK family protein [Thermaerobacter sp.]
MLFRSPSHGVMDLDQVFGDIVAFIREDALAQHKLIIGTDSQARDEVTYVTAIIIHRLGKGARYYYFRQVQRRVPTLRQRILLETSYSLGVASKLTEMLSRRGYQGFNIEIHLDIGQNGDTRDLIREIVGMVSGSGFDAKIKPDSFGASSVADKYTK